MEIQLSPPLEDYVRDKLDRGDYPNADELFQDALGLLAERDRLRADTLRDLREQLAIGVEQLDRGQFTTYDETTLPLLIEKVIARGREQLEAERAGFGR